MGQITFFQDGEYKGSIETDPNCRHEHAEITEKTCGNGCCNWWRCLDCGKLFLVECPD